jgi:hypothetical protein
MLVLKYPCFLLGAGIFIPGVLMISLGPAGGFALFGQREPLTVGLHDDPQAC